MSAGLRTPEVAPSTGSDTQTPKLPSLHGETNSSGSDGDSGRAPSVASIHNAGLRKPVLNKQPTNPLWTKVSEVWLPL